MENFINFKKLEVTGRTKQEALEKAPFYIQGDATQAFKLWKKSMVNGVTERDIKQFCVAYLTKKSKNAPGSGFYVTLDPAVADTRERPYRIEDVKNEGGKRKYLKTYVLSDAATGEVLATTNETKAKAKEVAKDMYKNGFRGDIVCTLTKNVVEGEPVAFRSYYTPSKASHAGTYLVFGVEA